MGHASNIMERTPPRTLREDVEGKLREAIIGNRFPQGAHLSDRVLSEAFGASRNIVREVVRALEVEGLVTIIPNRGPFVNTVTAAEAAQIYELRGALEAVACEGFAARASDQERAELERVFKEMCRAKDPLTLGALKEQFYAILLKGCRNYFVEQTLHRFFNRIARLRAMTMATPGRMPNSIREMRKIMVAIRARDGEAAAQASRQHVRAAGLIAVTFLREQG
jgi:DNA-binding GntR family transcriptional regulator